MNRTTTTQPHSSPTRSQTLTIRLALPADAAAIRRLAQLDSAVPAPVPMLVAEVGDVLHAALPLDGRPAIADPFRRTTELVAMLAERARQLDAPAPPRASWGAHLRPRRMATAPRV